MKRIIIGLVITGIAIGILSVSFIYSQTQEPAATVLPTVEDLIKKVEQNVEKIQDLRADVKKTEQEMNISKTEFSVKQVLKTTEYTFLFKKPDLIKIIPKSKPDALKTKEEVEKIYQQHPEWTEKEKVEYYGREYLPQVVDLISIGQAEYYVDTGTKKLTDKMPFVGPMASGSWEDLLEPRQLHLAHNRLRKLLEPFIMQNALTVKKDEKSPDVYVIKGKFAPHNTNPSQTSPYGWDWETWEPVGDDEVTVKIDYKKGVILQSNIQYTQDFMTIRDILIPIKFMHIELRLDKEKEKKFVQTLIEFSNVEINKGIKDEEFSFDNTKGYDISRYRIKLLNEK
jgi:outer membrane lipoprotein-sorting protein